MATTILQVKEHLTGMGHGGTLKKIRNIEALLERAGNNVLSRIDPVDSIRTTPLTNAVHDSVYDYPLPSDFGKIIDLIPQDDRTGSDKPMRRHAQFFDLKKGLERNIVSIESKEVAKYIRIDWPVDPSPVTVNTMDSLTGNGTWSAVGTASGLKANELYKVSGTASIEFDSAASGDGIQNTTMTAVDLTNQDELADFFTSVYLGAVTNLTSLSLVWGNDLTTSYWTSVAQTTQADGTAFKIGWNLIKFPWSTATETGTVTPSTIDSFKLTGATTGAISNIRVDNIICSLGRMFDIKYYSKYLFKNSAGTFLARPTSDDDYVILDQEALNIFLLEAHILCAQQSEGTDSTFDINWARNELYDPRTGLYALYKGNYQSQKMKETTRYYKPRFFR